MHRYVIDNVTSHKKKNGIAFNERLSLTVRIGLDF